MPSMRNLSRSAWLPGLATPQKPRLCGWHKSPPTPRRLGKILYLVQTPYDNARLPGECFPWFGCSSSFLRASNGERPPGFESGGQAKGFVQNREERTTIFQQSYCKVFRGRG